MGFHSAVLPSALAASPFGPFVGGFQTIGRLIGGKKTPVPYLIPGPPAPSRYIAVISQNPSIAWKLRAGIATGIEELDDRTAGEIKQAQDLVKVTNEINELYREVIQTPARPQPSTSSAAVAENGAQLSVNGAQPSLFSGSSPLEFSSGFLTRSQAAPDESLADLEGTMNGAAPLTPLFLILLLGGAFLIFLVLR